MLRVSRQLSVERR